MLNVDVRAAVDGRVSTTHTHTFAPTWDLTSVCLASVHSQYIGTHIKYIPLVQMSIQLQHSVKKARTVKCEANTLF